MKMQRDPSFSFRQLRYYVAAAEAGSISVASKRLYISQSSISKAVQDLEDEFGFKLLNRTAHGMSMTEEGEQFLQHAKKIIADVAGSREIFTARQHALQGELRIGVTPLVAAYVFPEILGRFRISYPNVDIIAQEDSREHLEHLLIGGDIDVALVLLKDNTASAFGTEIIDVSVYKVWASMGHGITEQGMARLNELGEYPQILLDVDEIEGDVSSMWEARQIKPDIVFRTKSVEALRSLVAGGVGIALVPDLAFRHWSLDGGAVEAIDIEEGLGPVLVAAVWRRGSSLSEAIQAFLSMVRRQG